MKYFGSLTMDQILWEMSWVNLNMLLATIPVFSTDKKKKEDEEGIDDEDFDALNDSTVPLDDESTIGKIIA